MSNMTPALVNVLGTFSKPELALMLKTVAKDCNPTEFDQFITTAARVNLNPLKRQIYAIVYNKDKPNKRNMVLITSIGGYRTIAERSGDYRPDHELPVFTYDEKLKGPANPAGLVSVTVRVFKYIHGEWFPTPHSCEWTSYAPIIEGGTWEDKGETWQDGNPKKTFVGNGTFTLDPTRGQWIKDPKGMLAKCAEAGALRKAWPDDLSNLYTDAEMDKATTLDLQPSEYAEQQAVDNRLAMIGGKDTILFNFEPEGIRPIHVGKINDCVEEYFKGHDYVHEVISTWQEQNRHGLQEFWARSKADAMGLKKRIEELLAKKQEPKT